MEQLFTLAELATMLEATEDEIRKAARIVGAFRRQLNGLPAVDAIDAHMIEAHLTRNW